MPVGVKRKDQKTLTPPLPPTVNTEKKTRGASVLARVRAQAKAQEEQIQKTQENAIKDSPPPDKDEAEPLVPDFGTDFMADLLWVYGKLGGRTALLSKARNDPQVRNQVYQTLLRMEFKKQEKKMKNDDPGKKKKGLLLIFKGLEDAEKGLRVGRGKIGREDVAGILYPNSDLNESGAQERDTYQYSTQELTDEEEKGYTEGQDQDGEGERAGGESGEETEEIVMDEIVEDEQAGG